MGMYDKVICYCKLPENKMRGIEFQTYDFDNCLDKYIVSKEGYITFEERNQDWCQDRTFIDKLPNLNRTINLSGLNMQNGKMYKFKMKFVNGIVKSVI